MARRLNRVEYNNTIRDLLGVAAKPADEFPVDDSGYGFDNVADAQGFSPTVLEGYMRAASPQKWLEAHGLEHWTHFYTDYGVNLQKRFFGYFLKGAATGWERQPRVQLQVTARPVRTLLFASRVVTDSCVVPPTCRLAVAGETETLATGTGAGAVTVMAEKAVFPSLEAEMEALPADTTVTTPDVDTE